MARTEQWGLRSLAYRIKKNRKGHYVFMHLEAPGEAIHEMERTMRINEDVMRFLTIRVDEFDPNPSPIALPAANDSVSGLPSRVAAQRHLNTSPGCQPGDRSPTTPPIDSGPGTAFVDARPRT